MQYRYEEQTYFISPHFCLLVSTTVGAQIREFERSTPEAEGVPSGALIALMDSLMALPKTDIHSVMVLRHGKVIAEMYPEPFAPEYRHTMFSCSKTLSVPPSDSPSPRTACG